MTTLNYPVLVLCGRDPIRRELLRVLDPEDKYPSKYNNKVDAGFLKQNNPTT